MHIVYRIAMEPTSVAVLKNNPGKDSAIENVKLIFSSVTANNSNYGGIKLITGGS